MCCPVVKGKNKRATECVCDGRDDGPALKKTKQINSFWPVPCQPVSKDQSFPSDDDANDVQIFLIWMVFIGEPFQRSTFTVMESSREETPRATGAAGHVQVQQQQQHYSIRNVNPIVVNAGGIQQQQQQQQHYSHPAASVIVQNAAVLGGGTAALVNMNNSSSPQHPGK